MISLVATKQQIAAGHGTFGVAEHGWTQGRPLAIVAGLYSASAAETWSPIFWWIHFLTILAFDHLPFSKHLHCSVRRQLLLPSRDMGRTLPSIDFEAEKGPGSVGSNSFGPVTARHSPVRVSVPYRVRQVVQADPIRRRSFTT